MEPGIRHIRRRYRVKVFIFSGCMFTKIVYANGKQEALDYCRGAYEDFPTWEFEARSLGEVTP